MPRRRARELHISDELRDHARPLSGELGRRTGVNTHQLHHCEAESLLEADRGANGYREVTGQGVGAVSAMAPGWNSGGLQLHLPRGERLRGLPPARRCR
ncbi:MerR family DNA-binding transcriptional regulator [Streptomyces noursei]|uniref:MerR family DNA-binding transcriptional regulator n=1 Tax=Streptomyces noursei TaxID=1971 RepID=UPI003798C16D